MVDVPEHVHCWERGYRPGDSYIGDYSTWEVASQL